MIIHALAIHFCTLDYVNWTIIEEVPLCTALPHWYHIWHYRYITKPVVV
jgi:hypothetical protein